MEQLEFGIMMLLSFIAGAYVRQPIRFIIRQKEHQNVDVPRELSDEELEEMKEVKRIQKQYEALYAYTEKSALQDKGTRQ